MSCSSHRFRVAQSQTDHLKPAAGCTMSGQVQQDQPVCRKPAQQDHRLVDRGPVTPEVRKRHSGQELGNAITDVRKGDADLLAAAVKNGCVFHGDSRDMPVFEQIKAKCIPKLDWSPTLFTPTKNENETINTTNLSSL